MTTIRCNGNWVQFHDNQCLNEDDDDDESALSLCDLPTNDIQIDSISNKQADNSAPEDFEFRSCNTTAVHRSPENMCHAEEVFFEGQILPLRHRVTRSASLSVVSSRVNGNDTRKGRSNEYEYGYKPKIRNQFHSHPSPSPQIRTQSFRTLSQSNPKMPSSVWSFLQVGLVKPQEIGLSDLKNRSKRFGSHNSNSSSTSNSSYNTINDQNQNKKMETKTRKKKQRLFSGGCKCSAVTIDRAIKEAVPKKKTTKEERLILHLRNLQGERESRKETVVSGHRTFEWLKQLSLADQVKVN